MDGQVVEEGAHVVGVELARVRRVVEAAVADDPLAVPLLRVTAKVTSATGRGDSVEEGGAGGRRGHERTCLG